VVRFGYCSPALRKFHAIALDVILRI